jgi:hypothetical protein
MRNSRSLAVVGVLGVSALIGWSMSSPAQTPRGSPPDPARDAKINPPVAKCNDETDTIPDPAQPTKRIAAPITAKLLTSPQPCQQRVSTSGLFDGDPLGNLQRGFDFYSWLTFIAMNSPADGKTIGQGPRPGGDAFTKWEDLANFRPLGDVMLPKGRRPTWGTRDVPKECRSLDGKSSDGGKKIIFHLGEEAFNQPFKTGPLIDQDGNFALFDILMNRPMYGFIVENGLYSKEGQEKFKRPIRFLPGNNPVSEDATKGIKAEPGRMGAIMLKVSYRILDPERNKDLIDKFHTSDALIYFPGPPATKTGPACVEKKLGLVGFHVGHKTRFAPQWVWTSFEHVSNVPDAAPDGSVEKKLDRYSFFNAKCTNDCPAVNDTPPQPWDPDTSLKFKGPHRSQVVRTRMLPEQVIDEVAKLNEAFRGLLRGTVWENYILLTTQWPSNNVCVGEVQKREEEGKDLMTVVDPTCAPAPTYLANTTLETYSQGKIPLASSSCMACHGNATTQHVPATASDFTFILEKAQSAKR